MEHISVFDLLGVRTRLTHNELDTFLDYVLKNREYLIPSHETSAIFKIRTLVATPTTIIFQRAVELGLDKLFGLFIIPPGVKDYPESITTRHITMDTVQMTGASRALLQTCALVPQMDQKILLNITQMLKRTGGFSDITGFHNAVVRDLLSRSYYTDNRATWLTPSLLKFVARVYSMSMGTAVSQWFSLDLAVQELVTTYFALFYLNLMSNAHIAKDIATSSWKELRIASGTDLVQIYAHIEETLGKPSLDSLEDVCTMIDSLGIGRVIINRKVLISRLRLTTDIQLMSLAMDYPPYFVYLILQAASGISKMGLGELLKKKNLMKPAVEFAGELSRTSMFLPLLAH